ncbi:nucleotide excision repair, TFIIH, subunit [Rhizophagus clarus]|uniref:General transcription and DNA repair factor IIH subunit TFB5 n=1 Tax=Rhizophagus clarus TaxID=94130 RepID=A0A8H3KUF0_9GLOM|nr:nucleotide excision repair, TFIIH, subunit [Rhizophagus clarus]
MVRVVQGTHIKCSDDTIRQLLLFLNEKMNFIIEEDGLDLIVKSDQVEEIKIELERILEENRHATGVTSKTTSKD